MTNAEPTADADPDHIDLGSLWSITEGFDRINTGIRNNGLIDSQERGELLRLITEPFIAGKALVKELISTNQPTPIGSPLRSAVIALDGVLRRVEKEILNAKYRDILDYISLTLTAIVELFARYMEVVPSPHAVRDLDFKRQLISATLKSASLLKQQESVNQIHVHVQQIAEDVQEAAGVAANSEMATFYQERAEGEKRRYLIWNALFFAASAIAASLGWYVLSRSSGATLTAQELARATIVLPVLVFAGYAARQASYHRNHESEAQLIAVQLKTVRAYSDVLDPTSRQELFQLLGTKIFGHSSGQGSPPADDSSDSEALSGLPASLIQELRKLVPGQRASGSS